MSSPLSVKKNDYNENPKPNDVETPIWLAEWVQQLVVESNILTELDHNPVIYDPAVGKGNLTNFIREKFSYTIVGTDIKEGCDQYCDFYIPGPFQSIDEWPEDVPTPDIIICNPPFNRAPGKKLYPELYLRKIDDLFGNLIPVLMFVPMGMRLNQKLRSSRWRYMRENWNLTTIITLPIDVFKGVAFHAELIGFNTGNLFPHYFIPDEIIPLEEILINGTKD